MDAIVNRRSIRKYTSEPVSDESLHKILEAAMCAPTAGNQRPWHFVVIRDRAVLNHLANLSQFSHMLSQCSLAIVVCGDLDAQKFEGYWVQDCSAATQNILTMVVELGLGAVWLGVYPLEDRIDFVSKTLELPVNILPLNVISIGHPAEVKPKTERFDPSRLHYNKW
jgi:nitroreductase